MRIRYLFPNPSQKVADTEFVRGLELHKKVSFKWTLRSLGCSESCGGGKELCSFMHGRIYLERFPIYSVRNLGHTHYEVHVLILFFVLAVLTATKST